MGRNERDAVRYDTNEFIAEVKKLIIDYEKQLPRDYRLADTALDRRFRRFVKKWERQEEERWKAITEVEAVFEMPDDDEQLVSIQSLVAQVDEEDEDATA